MYVKYLITVTEAPIGIKYNLEKQVCIIGGNPMHIPEMESLITDYFEKSNVPRKKFFARNKVRMQFEISNKKFYESLRKIKDHGIPLDEVKSHGRLMR